jgi:hypothetical protein
VATSSTLFTIRWPNRQERGELCGLFAAHFIGGLLPLWGSWLLIKLIQESASFTEFIRHGEFLLYAASILPTAAFLVLRDLKAPFPKRLLLGLLVIFFLVVATLLFAVVFIKTRNDAPAAPPSIDVVFLGWVSIPLYLLSLALMLLTTFFDMLIASYDPIVQQKREESEFAKLFRELKD